MVKVTVLKLAGYKKNIMKKLIGAVTETSQEIKKRLVAQARDKILSLLQKPLAKYLFKKSKFVIKADVDKKTNYFFSSSDTINLLCPDLGVGRTQLEKIICASVGGQCRLEIGQPIGWKFLGGTLGSSGLKKERVIAEDDKTSIISAIKNNGNLHDDGDELINWEKSCCWLCGLPLIFSKIHWEYKVGDEVNVPSKYEGEPSIPAEIVEIRGVNDTEFEYKLKKKKEKSNKFYKKSELLFKSGPPECEHKLPILLLLFFCAGPTSAKKITNEVETDTATEVEAHGDSSIQDGSFSLDQTNLSVINDSNNKFRLDPEYLKWKREVRSCSYVWSHKVCNRVKNAMCFVRIIMNDDGLIEYGIDEWRIMKWAQLIARNKPDTTDREFNIIFDDNRGDWEQIYNRAFKGGDEYDFFKHYEDEDGVKIETTEKKAKFLKEEWEYIIHSNLITQVELIVDTLNKYPGYNSSDSRIKREFLWRNMILNKIRLTYYLKKLDATGKDKTDAKLMTFYRNIKIMLRTSEANEIGYEFSKAVTDCQDFLREMFPEHMDMEMDGGAPPDKPKYLFAQKESPIRGKIPTSPTVNVNEENELILKKGTDAIALAAEAGRLRQEAIQKARSIKLSESDMIQTNIKLEELFSEVLGLPIKQNHSEKIENKNEYLEKKNKFFKLLVDDDTLPGTNLEDVINKDNPVVAFSFGINYDFDEEEDEISQEVNVELDDMVSSSSDDSSSSDFNIGDWVGNEPDYTDEENKADSDIATKLNRALLNAQTSDDLLKVIDIAKVNLMKNSMLNTHPDYNVKNIEILKNAYFNLRLPFEHGGIGQHHWDLTDIEANEHDYEKQGKVWKYIEDEYSSGKFNFINFANKIDKLKKKYEDDNETITLLDRINTNLKKIPSHQGGSKKKRTKRKRKKRKKTRRKKRKKRKKTRRKKRKKHKNTRKRK